MMFLMALLGYRITKSRKLHFPQFQFSKFPRNNALGPSPLDRSNLWHLPMSPPPPFFILCSVVTIECCLAGEVRNLK